jgi:thiol-disulfide isomerase/thioredoxin
MTRSSRESRREAARAREAAERRQRWLLPTLAVGVILLAAVGALFLANGMGDGSSDRPSDLPTSSAPGAGPVITGAPLPAFQSPTSDPAVGSAIPEVSAPSASITADGTAKVILFLAHWCPHCQSEVPVVQDWVDSGSLPADVELISVSTAIDPARPNYPPDAWLDREGWTIPVITDGSGAVADAYGLSAFPCWVFVNADGTVAGRLTGELTPEQLDTVVASLAR